MGDTKISYVTRRWDPVRGCTPVSAGCKNCFAARFAIRQAGQPTVDGGQVVIREAGPYAGLVRSTSRGPTWTGEVRFFPEALDAPLRWRAPQRIAVGFGGDLFHPSVRPEWIDRILEVIAATPRHAYLALTKRPELFEEKLYGVTPYYGCRTLGGGDYAPNLWLGVSVEDQSSADARIPWLLQTTAATRWVSVEPLLGAVDFAPYLTRIRGRWMCPACGYRTNRDGEPCPNDLSLLVADRALDWVVIGGESGPGHREMPLGALKLLVAQCDAAGVPVWVKQDSGPRAGQQGRIPADLWARRALPR